MVYCNLAILMAERKVKISKVASDTGISRTTLTALYYNTGQGVQYDTASALCIYFNIEMGELFSSYPYDLFVTGYDIQRGENAIYAFDCKLVTAKDTEFPRLTGTFINRPLKRFIKFNHVQHDNSDVENQLLTDMFKRIPRDCFAIVRERFLNVLEDDAGIRLKDVALPPVELEFPEYFVSEEN